MCDTKSEWALLSFHPKLVQSNKIYSNLINFSEEINDNDSEINKILWRSI